MDNETAAVPTNIERDQDTRKGVTNRDGASPLGGHDRPQLAPEGEDGLNPEPDNTTACQHSQRKITKPSKDMSPEYCSRCNKYGSLLLVAFDLLADHSKASLRKYSSASIARTIGVKLATRSYAIISRKRSLFVEANARTVKRRLGRSFAAPLARRHCVGLATWTRQRVRIVSEETTVEQGWMTTDVMITYLSRSRRPSRGPHEIDAEREAGHNGDSFLLLFI